jgi:hypothetical protein
MCEFINEVLRKNTAVFNIVNKIRGKFENLLSERYLAERMIKTDLEKKIKSLEKDYSALGEARKKAEIEFSNKFKQLSALNVSLAKKIEELENQKKMCNNSKFQQGNQNSDIEKNLRVENQRLKDIIFSQQNKIMINKEKEQKMREFLKALKMGGIEVDELEELFLKNEDTGNILDGINEQEHEAAAVATHGKKKKKNKGSCAGSDDEDESYPEPKVRGAPKRSARECTFGSEADISGFTKIIINFLFFFYLNAKPFPFSNK